MLESYQPGRAFDEAFYADGDPRPHYQRIIAGLNAYGKEAFHKRRALIDLMMRQQGVTFTVYSDAKGVERTFPFDPFPRIIPAREWAQLETGLKQRVRAINLFLHDIYHEQAILKEGVIPRR